MNEHCREGAVPGAQGVPVAWSLDLPTGPGPHPLVVLCHGFKGFKDWGFFPALAQHLADEGLAALRFNYSHDGLEPGTHASQQADGIFPTFPRLDLFERDRMSYRLTDFRAVVGAVRSGEIGEGLLATERLGVFGHSMGGAVALIAAVESQARALVTWAGIRRAEFPPEQVEILERDGVLEVPNGRTGQRMPVGRCALEDIRQNAGRFDLDRLAPLAPPWVLVHGEADPTVDVSASRELHALAPTRARLEVISGADHVFGAAYPYRGAPTHLQRAFRVTSAAFRDHLGQGE